MMEDEASRRLATRIKGTVRGTNRPSGTMKNRCLRVKSLAGSVVVPRG
jgi:hypothetical protein